MFPGGTGTGAGGTSGAPGWLGPPGAVGTPGKGSFQDIPFPSFPLQSSTVSGPFYLKSGSGAVQLANQAWNTGDRMVPLRSDASSNVAVAQGWVWECTISGTSTGTPTWPATVIQDVTTVAQNGVVWTARKPGYPGGTSVNWSYATIFADYLLQASSGVAGGNTIYGSNHHAESIAGAITLTWPSATLPVYLICVDDSAAPPIARSTGASITTTGANGITINSAAANLAGYIADTIFNVGTGASAATFTVGGRMTFINGTILLVTTASGSRIILAGNANDVVTARGLLVSFGANGQQVNYGQLDWDGGGIAAGSVVGQTTMFTNNVTGARLLVTDLDFSVANGGSLSLHGSNVGADVIGKFRNCKVSANSAFTNVALNTDGTARGTVFDFDGVSSGSGAFQSYRSSEFGTQAITSVIVPASPSAASDGSTSISWKIVTTALPLYPQLYFVSKEFCAGWVQQVGSPMTLTVEFNHDSLAGLDNSQIWLELSALDTSGSPLGVLVSSQVADVLTTPTVYSASSTTWTTTGETNPNNQLISATFTPRIVGPVIGRIVVAKPSYTVYVSPKLTMKIGGIAIPTVRQYQVPGGAYVNEGLMVGNPGLHPIEEGIAA